jgi:RmlD substrate binding domain
LGGWPTARCLSGRQSVKIGRLASRLDFGGLRWIAWLVTTESYELYDITNGGQCTWYDIASRIFQLSGLKPDLSPTTAAFGAKARRPAYSVLGHG